ncbi:MAG: cytochrome c3 family protein [Anaeromyxobacteraceae bacterium]
MRLALRLAVAACSLPVLVAASSGGHGRSVGGSGPCEMRTADRRATSSQRCLACHDGTVAPGSLVPAGRAGELGDHPIDVDYEGSRVRGQLLRPAAELPPSLPLVNGRVACTTCHAPDSPEPGHTALPMRRSAMCFACHAL